MGIKRLVVRYAWAGPVIGFVFGFLFGPGVVWQLSEFHFKSRSAELEETRMEKELYEGLQTIRNDILTAIPQYIALRDEYFADQANDSANYSVQNEYIAAEPKIRSLFSEYNHLEAKLSILEGRSPRFMEALVSPMAVQNFKQTKLPDGTNWTLSWDPYKPDPLQVDVVEDLNTLIQQTKLKFPVGIQGGPSTVPHLYSKFSYLTNQYLTDKLEPLSASQGK